MGELHPNLGTLASPLADVVMAAARGGRILSLAEALRVAAEHPTTFTHEQLAVLCGNAADEIEFLRDRLDPR